MATGAHKTSMAALMTALLIAETTSTFEASMAFAALPTLNRHFGNPLGVSWTITLFFLVSAAVAALLARAGDLYGRRRILLLVLAVAGAGSLISGLSTSLGGVIVGRGMQGVTGALFPLCLGLMREHIDSRRLPFWIGVMGGVVGVSAGVAFLVAGIILDQFDWRALFYCSAGLAFLGILSVWTLVPPSHPALGGKRIDILGGALFVPAISGILLAISHATVSGWQSPLAVVFMVVGSLLLIAWARHEWKHPEPLIDVRLFQDRRILVANAVFALAAVGPFVNAHVVMLFAQQPLWTGVGLGLTATLAGLLKQPVTVTGLVAGPVGGQIAAHRGARAAILCGTAAITCAWTFMLVSPASLPVLLAVVAINAFGVTILYGAVANQIVEAAPPGRTSEAIGLAQVTRATFMAIGSQVLALILTTATVADPVQGGTASHPAQSAYSLAFAFLALAGALAFVAGWLLPGAGGSLRAGDSPLTPGAEAFDGSRSTSR